MMQLIVWLWVGYIRTETFSVAPEFRFAESTTQFQKVALVPEISNYSKKQLKDPRIPYKLEYVRDKPLVPTKHMILTQSSTSVGVQLQDLQTDNLFNFQNPTFIHTPTPTIDEKFIKNTTILQDIFNLTDSNHLLMAQILSLSHQNKTQNHTQPQIPLNIQNMEPELNQLQDYITRQFTFYQANHTNPEEKELFKKEQERMVKLFANLDLHIEQQVFQLNMPSFRQENTTKKEEESKPDLKNILESQLLQQNNHIENLLSILIQNKDSSVKKDKKETHNERVFFN